MKRLFSFLSLMVLAVSIPVTLTILQSGNLDLRIRAFDSDEPKNVLITDVTGSSFRVSWTTDRLVLGGVKLAQSDRTPLFDIEPSRGHSIVVGNLEPGRKYQFKILSGSKEYGNGNIDFIVDTANITRTGASFWIYGQVFSQDGVNFQKNGIVQIQLSRGNNISQTVSANLNEVGGYQVNLESLLDETLQREFIYFGEIDITITVYTTSTENSIKTRKFTVDLNSSRQLPNFHMGDVTFEEIPGIQGT